MKPLTLKEWEAESPENRRELAEEALILEASEAIWNALEEVGLSKADLAARLNVSKSHVTQLLNGSRNMTLRSLADLADALDRRVHIEFRKRAVEMAWVNASSLANVVDMRAYTPKALKPIQSAAEAPMWVSLGSEGVA